MVVYRIGTPFTRTAFAARHRYEIAWSIARADAVESDSLRAGSLQPVDENEDVAATLLSRGGWVTADLGYFSRDPGLHVMVDGDPATAWTWPRVFPESFASFHLYFWGVTLGLGGEFLVREVAFRPLSDRPDHYLENFQVQVRAKGEGEYGRYAGFLTVAEVKENAEPDVRMTLDPPVTSEEVRLQFIRHSPKEVGIADIEVYGGGFLREAFYESEVIEMEDLASWGEIHWGGRRDSQARVRTRTGDDMGTENRTSGPGQIPPGRGRPGLRRIQTPVRSARGIPKARGTGSEKDGRR